MSQVLYRKYRPQSFSEIIGQEHVIPLLIESILKDKISHACLFSGPRGCGKTTVARIMAKALNCINFDIKKDACNECVYCVAINSGNNIDIVEMDAASNRGIEEMRSLKETINFMPSFLKRKVYIIDEAHMLTKEAFNALLKTLEEPPEHVVFILATTESNKLPITILSRLTRFDFKLGDENEIINKLNYIVEKEKINIDPQGLKIIYQYSGGSFRDAESLLGKIILSHTHETNITQEEIRASLGIVSAADINDLIRLMKAADIREIKKVLDRIFINDSNPSLIIDQLLDRIKDELYLNLDNTDTLKIYNIIIRRLVKVKNELKEFFDKKLIIEIEFYEISREIKENRSNPVLLETKVEQESKVKEEVLISKASETKLELISKDEKRSFPEANVEDSFINNNEGDDLVQYIVEESKQILPRLVPIIKGSFLVIKSDSITISNPYKFNLSYLKKKEVIEHIQSIILKHLHKNYELIFIVSDEINKLEDEKQTIIETKSNKLDNTQLVEHGSDIAFDNPYLGNDLKDQTAKAKPRSLKDNSDLVESIILS